MKNFKRLLFGLCVSTLVVLIFFYLDEPTSYKVQRIIEKVYIRQPQILNITSGSANHTVCVTPKPCTCNNTLNSSTKDNLLSVQFDGRMGNHMFQYAALLGLAKINNRTPFIIPSSELKEAFRFSKSKSFSDPVKWEPMLQEKYFGRYDTTFNSLPQKGNLKLQAFLQSWKYFENVKDEVLSEFQFLPHIKEKAEKMLEVLLADKYKDFRKNLTLVGVHVRRGDRLRQDEIKLGDRVAPVSFFKKAFDWMRNKHKQVKFLVTSDDMNWVKNSLKADDLDYLHKEGATVHLCVLTKCNHVIMSVGTFGWWAGYLGGGDVIYYNKPISNNSWKTPRFDMNDHYPKHWIGVGD